MPRHTRFAALSNRSRFTKLKEVHINAGTTSVEIDLSDIDWTQWANIHLDYLPTNGSQMWLFINSVSDSTRFYPISGSGGLYRPWLTFYVGFRADRGISASYIHSGFTGCASYAEVQKFIITGDTMHPGAHFILWGEK